MRRVEGKVALVSGAARGMGRAHAVRLAEEGADIIAFDACEDQFGTEYRGASESDLEETVRMVEQAGRRILAAKADVKRLEQIEAIVAEGVALFGRLDIVSATAGIAAPSKRVEDIPDTEFLHMLDVNLAGVWRTARTAIPHLRSGGRGGAIVLTSSVAGMVGFENVANYVAAKHGVIGLMRTMARELGPDMIRVNSILPTVTNTDMAHNKALYKLFCPETVTREDFAAATSVLHAMPIPWVEAEDCANALLFLVSDEARYITGVALPVDGGACIK